MGLSRRSVWHFCDGHVDLVIQYMGEFWSCGLLLDGMKGVRGLMFIPNEEVRTVSDAFSSSVVSFIA